MTSSVLLIKIQICVSIMFKNVHVQVSKHETFIYYSMNLILNKNECELFKRNHKLLSITFSIKMKENRSPVIVFPVNYNLINQC
jgi:hypothetical protein